MRSCGAPRCPAAVTLVLVACFFIGFKKSHANLLNLTRLSTAAAPVFSPEDFVVVINTDQERLQLALASRPLRRGIRTYIVLDNVTLAEELQEQNGNLFNETFAYFPNRNLTGPETDKPGDTRWQAAPFMAHHHYGPTYKWILLGDDDTLWFLGGLARLLHGYDPTLPYAISDHLGDHNLRGFFVPSPLAAVCSPCHWPQLLAATHQEPLLARSSGALSETEAAEWNPKDLDGWGIGVLPMPRKMAKVRGAVGDSEGGGGVGAGEGVGRGSRASGGFPGMAAGRSTGGGSSEGDGGGRAVGGGGGMAQDQILSGSKAGRRSGGGGGDGGGKARSGRTTQRGNWLGSKEHRQRARGGGFGGGGRTRKLQSLANQPAEEAHGHQRTLGGGGQVETRGLHAQTLHYHRPHHQHSRHRHIHVHHRHQQLYKQQQQQQHQLGAVAAGAALGSDDQEGTSRTLGSGDTPGPELQQLGQGQDQGLPHQELSQPEGVNTGGRYWALQARQRQKLSLANMSAQLHTAYYGYSLDFYTAGGDRGGGDAATAAVATAAQSPIPPPGCPCRPEAACLHRARLCRDQDLCSRALVFRIDFRGNRSWCRHSWAHGGAGVVLSVGLMSSVAGGPVEECARTTDVHSCDMNLAMCLMKAAEDREADGDVSGGSGEGSGGSGEGSGGGDEAWTKGGEGGGGYMFTHPGSAALLGAHWADPRFIVFDNPVYQHVLYNPAGLLAGRLRCGPKARTDAVVVAAAHALGTGLQLEPAVRLDEGDDGGDGEGGDGGVGSDGSSGGEAAAGAAVEGAGGVAAGMAANAAGLRGRQLRAAGQQQQQQGLREQQGLEQPLQQRDPQELILSQRDMEQQQTSEQQTQQQLGRGGASGDDEDQAICRWLVQHAVSLHIHRRRYPSTALAVEAVQRIVAHHQQAAQVLRAASQVGSHGAAAR